MKRKCYIEKKIISILKEHEAGHDDCGYNPSKPISGRKSVRILLAVLVFLPLSALAEVVTVDFVKVLNGNTAEAIYFYENNWKKFRSAAVEKGIISSYKLLVSGSEKGQTDILLITVFASPEQYERREENFLIVMRDARESGPALLNDKPPSEFREVVDKGMYTSVARPPEG